MFAAGLILLFGSLVQGAIGFALGLIAVPLLLAAHFTLSEAVALTTLSIGIQVLFGASMLRAHIPWSDVKLAAVVRYVTVPIGVLILLEVESMDSAQVRRLVGVFILAALVVRVYPTQARHRTLPLPATIATFSASGVLQGLVAMGGPPVVLWMTTRDFTAKQARAFTMTLFLLNTPVQISLLLILSESMTLDTVLTALALSPLILLGTTIGVRAGGRFSKPLLNRLALGVLLIIALKAVF